MIIHIKNKDTLIVDGFKFKCSVGRGIRKNKFEGDFYTPSGKFEIGRLYWRPDRVQLPETKLLCKKIKKLYCLFLSVIWLILNIFTRFLDRPFPFHLAHCRRPKIMKKDQELAK